VVTVQAPQVPTSTPSQLPKAPPSSNTFLNNKPLAGIVFGLVALVTLILLVVAITYTVRRRRRNRLQSISFDPDTTSDHTYNHLIESGLGIQRQGSQSTTGQGRDTSSYDGTVSGLYPDYSGQQQQQQQQQQLYPGPTLFPQNPAYGNQQAYYNPQQHPPAYGFPSSLVPGYSPDTAYPSALPVLTQQQQAYTTAGLALGRRRNDSLSSLPSIVTSSQTHHRDGLGQGPAPDPSLPSPPLPNPYGDAVSPKDEMPPPQSLPRDVQPAPLKLAIPTAPPLPDHFGSDASSRSSMEEDMQFWSRRLKVGSPFAHLVRILTETAPPADRKSVKWVALNHSLFVLSLFLRTNWMAPNVEIFK
jgi:hypothetical protein